MVEPSTINCMYDGCIMYVVFAYLSIEWISPGIFYSRKYLLNSPEFTQFAKFKFLNIHKCMQLRVE